MEDGRLLEAIRKVVDVLLPLIAEHDTEFTAGYKEATFDSLRLGASRDDVERLLGAPFETWKERFSGLDIEALSAAMRNGAGMLTADDVEVWSYSRPATPGGNYLQRRLKFGSTSTLGEMVLVEKRQDFFYAD